MAFNVIEVFPIGGKAKTIILRSINLRKTKFFNELHGVKRINGKPAIC